MAKYAEKIYYEFAMKLTQEAAQILKSSVNRSQNVEEKQGNWDPVTEYDKRIEEMITSKLHNEFPNHKFIAEESVGKGELPELTDDPTWIVDPIDGTVNFIHGFPHVCIVIGLAIGKEMVLGIVYNPFLEQLFTARRGRGAFLNGRQIGVSKIQEMSKALICIESAFIKIESMKEKTVERLQDIAAKAQSTRSLGVAALTLCYVAMGAAEGYYIEGPGISTWDIAAASLIIEEAGGVVVDRVTGEKIDIMVPRAVAACNAKIAKEMVEIIHKADEKVDSRKK